jgi:hypothetical protein
VAKGGADVPLDILALRRLSFTDLVELTDLRVQQSQQRGPLIDDVRDQVIWQASQGGFEDPGLRETSIAQTVSVLVPPADRARICIGEFVLIARAWDKVPSLREFESVEWGKLATIAGGALTAAYGHAVRRLVDFAWTGPR